MNFSKTQLQEPKLQRIKLVCVICYQTFAMKNWLKKISRKSTLSSGKVIVAKYSEIEMN